MVDELTPGVIPNGKGDCDCQRGSDNGHCGSL